MCILHPHLLFTDNKTVKESNCLTLKDNPVLTTPILISFLIVLTREAIERHLAWVVEPTLALALVLVQHKSMACNRFTLAKKYKIRLVLQLHFISKGTVCNRRHN